MPFSKCFLVNVLEKSFRVAPSSSPVTTSRPHSGLNLYESNAFISSTKTSFSQSRECMSERGSIQKSAAERVNKASSVERANEWAVRANKQMDERVASLIIRLTVERLQTVVFIVCYSGSLGTTEQGSWRSWHKNKFGDVRACLPPNLVSNGIVSWYCFHVPGSPCRQQQQQQQQQQQLIFGHFYH